MKPRVVKPNNNNRYYVNTADGGLNGAKGNPKKKNPFLTSLPNCVAIYGWFNEIGGKGAVYLKKAWYPYSVIAEARREGLEITQEPTVGGIMVWTEKGGDGHVAGCAVKYEDGSILTSESEYYGAEWKNYHRTRGDGNWRDGCYWMGRTYVYQGCIKNPFIEDEDMTKAETEALIRELVPQILDEIKAETAKEPADDWAKEAINMCIARGIMVGYPDGFHAQSYMRREEVAQVVANLTAKE